MLFCNCLLLYMVDIPLMAFSTSFILLIKKRSNKIYRTQILGAKNNLKCSDLRISHNPYYPNLRSHYLSSPV